MEIYACKPGEEDTLSLVDAHIQETFSPTRYDDIKKTPKFWQTDIGKNGFLLIKFQHQGGKLIKSIICVGRVQCAMLDELNDQFCDWLSDFNNSTA